MAEVKQNFLKSKMNKDLDDRLVPVGEYRHAQNIAVAKSEGQDVGALENILGNNAVSNFALPDNTYGVEIIGQYMDVKNDRIIVFMTNYVDTSGSALNNFSPADAYHAIGMYEVLGGNSTILVTGRFLNFSKTHEIYGVNVIDNLLFWTDNRNQPRKINIANANPVDLAIPTYYTTEDTISVSKYYPYKTIDLVAERVTSAVFWPPVSTGYSGLSLPAMNLPCHNVSGSGNGYGLTVDVTAVDVTGQVTAFNINNPGFGYQNGDIVVIGLIPGEVPVGGAYLYLRTKVQSTMHDVTSDFLPDGTTDNPYRQPYDNNQDITWKGDPEYLKEKFVRFSYRFKFEDGEYSLIAPFTQTCFIPRQDGYFIGDDDTRTFKSTEVEFMQNKVNDIDLILTSPTGNWDDLRDTMKIVEVDILYKEAGQNSIKVLDTLTQTYISDYPSSILTYNYASSKPWKTLPSSEVLRVHDQVPVRALAQEIIDNRVVYGNYIDKPTPPATINYSANVIHKNTNDKIEYQNQNLKQNRTYQVGVVLSDRYGRQSTVILSTIDDYNISSTIKGSTIFNKFKTSPFSDYSSNGLFSATDAWDGDNLSLTFWAAISSGLSPNSLPNYDTGEPGLYNATTNPLGWYSYKIVVKQTEQDYYNIYFPGILNGYADGEAISTAATEKEPVCHFALHGDNINKVPRDLSLVGPNQKVFRTSRPTIKEDPSYYQFAGQQIDPYSDEGERLLKERDRERDLDAGSQVSNANVKLSLRLNNIEPQSITGGSTLTAIDTTTAQGYPGINLDTVNTIGTGVELGLWDAAGKPPFNTANVFYGYKNNPYIAKITVSAPITAGSEIQTGLTGPHPLSGKLNHWIEADGDFDGASYVAGSKNVLCTIPDNPPGVDASTGSGFKVNIDNDDNTQTGMGMPTAVSVADIGGGWDPLMSAGYIGTGGAPHTDNVKITGAGDGLAHFILKWNKTPFEGTMAPSLAVYETQPLKSKLDIYWETSTNGLIGELNDAIAEGDVVTPVKLTGLSGSLPEINHDEGMPTGQDITGPLFPTNGFGSPLSGPITASIISVDDNMPGTGDQSHLFTINNSVPGYNDAFSIETNGYWMVDIDSSTLHNYTFKIKINCPSSTYATGGGFIDRQITLGPYTVGNLPPYFVYDGDNVYDGTSGFIAKDDNPTQTATITTVYTTPAIDTSSMSYPALGGNIGWLDVPWYGVSNPWHQNNYASSTNWLKTSSSSRIYTGKEETDIDNVYNISNGVFTVPKTGIYNLHATAKFNARWWVAWYRDGSKQSQPVDMTSCVAYVFWMYNMTTNTYIGRNQGAMYHSGEIAKWSNNFAPSYWIPANNFTGVPTARGGSNGYIDTTSSGQGVNNGERIATTQTLNKNDEIAIGVWASWLGNREYNWRDANAFNRPFVNKKSVLLGGGVRTYSGIAQIQVTESAFSATNIEEIYYTNQTGDVYTFEVENGSNLSGGLEKDSIVFDTNITVYDENGVDITTRAGASNTHVKIFSLRDNNDGSATLVKNAYCAVGSYHVQITARDMSGTGNSPTTFEAVVVITSIEP